MPFLGFISVPPCFPLFAVASGRPFRAVFPARIVPHHHIVVGVVIAHLQDISLLRSNMSSSTTLTFRPRYSQMAFLTSGFQSSLCFDDSIFRIYQPLTWAAFPKSSLLRCMTSFRSSTAAFSLSTGGYFGLSIFAIPFFQPLPDLPHQRHVIVPAQRRLPHTLPTAGKASTRFQYHSPSNI